MKINNRIIIILFVAVCALIVALALISQFFILNTFSDIEQKQVTADIQRVLTRLNGEVEDVSSTCREWAQWDDTYAFIRDLRPGYIPPNPAEQALFRNMKINYVLFYNSSGDLVYSRGYNPEDGTGLEVPPELDSIVRNSIIPKGVPLGISGRRGYSLLNGEPVVLAGYQITTSDQKAPPEGTLVMARQLDAGQINDIAQQTDLGISIGPLPAGLSGGEFSDAELKLIENGKILVAPVNDSVMKGGAFITGIENTPTKILVSVEVSRPFNQQVRVSIVYVAGVILVIALFMIFAIRWPLRKYITGPILSLDTGMMDIGRSGDVSRKVPVQGDDEIRSLANSLNRMLEEISNAQKETIESESKFRTLTETSVAGIFVFRKKILYVNHAAELQTGYTREELYRMDFWGFVHPDFQDYIRNFAENLLKGENAVAASAEYKIIRKDGEERWIDSSAALFDYDGEKTLLSVRVDITGRKRSEEALRENEEKFRALTENTPDIVFSADLTGIFTYISPQVKNYGFLPDDLVGKSAFDFVFPEDWQPFSENFVKTLEDGCGHSTPFRILDKDQNIHWLEANFAVTSDRKGKWTGLQGMFRDITERRNALDAITLANKKLNLMYDITRHDILNKIAVLFGLVDMTKACPSPGEREQLLDEIRDAGDTIYRQIALTRDYQEVGVKAPRWNHIDDMIRNAVSSFSGPGVHFVSDIKNLEVYADPLIEKVIYNLVDNAIRYGKGLSAITFSTQASEKGLEILCEDNGIGIGPELKEKIFERGFGNNTGLGLFLCREILTITGITIREAGEPGKGARFIISLPPGTFRFGEK